jgi:hypothetical protein
MRSVDCSLPSHAENLLFMSLDIRDSLNLSIVLSEREYNWWNIGCIAWASWADYIGYIGLTPHVGTQCGTIPIYSNT